MLERALEVTFWVAKFLVLLFGFGYAWIKTDTLAWEDSWPLAVDLGVKALIVLALVFFAVLFAP